MGNDVEGDLLGNLLGSRSSLPGTYLSLVCVHSSSIVSLPVPKTDRR